MMTSAIFLSLETLEYKSDLRKFYASYRQGKCIFVTIDRVLHNYTLVRPLNYLECAEDLIDVLRCVAG